MADRRVAVPLPFAPPGTARRLDVLRFGTPGARPKAYLQAGLHADELPGMLAARYLAERLAALDADGQVRGEVVLVPAANPIGLGQTVLDRSIGRFELGGAGNFNRGYPDLAAAVAERLAGRLPADAPALAAGAREALGAVLAERPPRNAMEGLRHALMTLSHDADIVLDLHCDTAAPVHVYLGTPLWPDAEDLVARLGAEFVFLAEDSGGNPFDEACSAFWWRLAALLGDAGAKVPPACLSATVELRGAGDVDQATARRDASALVDFLAGRGVLAAPAPPAPDFTGAVRPLAGVEMVRAPADGIVLYRVHLGETVAPGTLLAEIVDPADPFAPTLPVHAGIEGPVWSIAEPGQRLVRAGGVIAKIAGESPLPGKDGNLLTA
ncbi:MAG: M14 family metallopeptidase [Azospirillaceae bacterium]